MQLSTAYIAALVLSLLVSTQASAAKPPEFLGRWAINAELTEELAPEFGEAAWYEGLGGGRVSVSVGGIPLPTGKSQPAPGVGAAKDPGVLHCAEMVIEEKDKELHFNFVAVGTEVMRRGSYRGRDTSWSKQRGQQKYKTTQRKVKKSWQIRSDGRLQYSVTLDPNNDKARTYHRVFDRLE